MNSNERWNMGIKLACKDNYKFLVTVQGTVAGYLEIAARGWQVRGRDTLNRIRTARPPAIFNLLLRVLCVQRNLPRFAVRKLYYLLCAIRSIGFNGFK
jgi:hypothetical protein